MSGIRVWRLKRRALRFLTDAKDDYVEGYYDVSAFHVGQSLQLYNKAVILEIFGKEYRGHGIRESFSYLSKLLRENGYSELATKVDEMVREYRNKLVSVEDAYLDSRYEDVEYDEGVMELISFAEKAINFLEEVVKSVKLG
ncbi:HEPN domain-containing protein [Stygiolobus caldivivus]|uniref:DNA-binding protein n=1 Tax=Stygiolobus caldivivus TaxID=2824673 RepID=A0A8D5U8H2_9CREN|nr:HEPN domain-containing protein [Stygiolobus caldivivus]BCU71561.1 DNA-binding protein [Stygiolobus caldivivus]